ncbi:hypothetical protein JM18_009886, partial [Phytophthora kernoviae]
MDKLIHYVNQDDRLNVLYSNLSYYTDMKRAEGLTWSVKTDDFMPYASADHEYWSGFFTSRPTLKRFARVANILLQQVRQLDAVYQSHHSTELVSLQRAVGLVQHHDGLSGTEKQSVAYDYALRLNDGIIDAEKEMNEVLFVIGEKEPFRFCLMANTSVCDVSTQNDEFDVLIHNALARTSVETISIPITHKTAEVQVVTGDATVRSQDVFVALPVHPETQVAPYSFVFSVELKPLSTVRLLVKQKTTDGVDVDDILHSTTDVAPIDDSEGNEVVVLENHLIRAEINKATGSITKLANKKKNIQIPLSLDVAYYQAFQGGNGAHSGAYLFRPDSNKTYPVTNATSDGIPTGSLPDVKMIDLQTGDSTDSNSVPRVAFKIGSWVTLEYRVNEDDEFLEIEWTVGSIPIKDNKGKEVILRLDAGDNIKSASKIYTDSNALEFMERVRNHRDTWNLTLHNNQDAVAANYFPITTGAYIKDTNRQLNLVTDRAQGAASLADGQLEVMVHRRLLDDDGKGVGEHLNETESVYDSATKTQVTKGLVIRGNFFINVDSAEDGMRSLRSKMESQFFRPLTVFRKAVTSADEQAKLPWLTVNDFPPNVGLTTMQELSKQCLMVRLSHLYAVDEHATLSQPATVDFSKLFTVKNAVVSEVTELTLTGTKPLPSSSAESSRFLWKTTDESNGASPRSLPVKGTSVVLQAIEVRAFRLCFGKSFVDADVESWDDEE